MSDERDFLTGVEMRDALAAIARLSQEPSNKGKKAIRQPPDPNPWPRAGRFWLFRGWKR